VIEILYLDGCPNHGGLEERIRSMMVERGVDATLVVRRIDSDEQANAEHFRGSPTIRVNGVDIDPAAPKDHPHGLTCRVYATDDGLRGNPPDAWIAAALEGLR
jgi:hypothetical protein